ncbi:hypothetical protein [Actinomadura litoris]|uniref:hypothetical protein n=1 Tax=Actinomadura litoris TaxID=2678616 RepID=UPI001FA75453|nr:hypothetical protein [Actinomadura litoris]
MVRAHEDPPSHGDPTRLPPLPRVTTIVPPGVIFDEAALVRPRPVIVGARARFGRFATGPLLRRRPRLPRFAAAPGLPRAHWQMPSGPFTRSPVMRSPTLGSTPSARVPQAPVPAPRGTAMTWRFPLLDRLPTLRRKQRP